MHVRGGTVSEMPRRPITGPPIADLPGPPLGFFPLTPDEINMNVRAGRTPLTFRFQFR